MKIYVASIFARRPEMRTVEARLKERGHECTSRWLWVTADNTPDNWPLLAQMDLDDVDASDALITFPQAYGSSNIGGGRHFELGYAYARKLPIVLVGNVEIIFHTLPRLTHARTLDEALDRLASL